MDNHEKKTAVIYYSYEGNCGFVAEAAGAGLGADIFRLEVEHEKKRAGFSKYFWGGGQVFMKKRPRLKPLDFSPDGYGRIVIGTPVWAGSPAPALYSFLEQNRITGKTVALFCCHAGGKGDALGKLKALLPGNTFTAGIDFVNPLKADRDKVLERISEWVRTL